MAGLSFICSFIIWSLLCWAMAAPATRVLRLMAVMARERVFMDSTPSVSGGCDQPRIVARSTLVRARFAVGYSTRHNRPGFFPAGVTKRLHAANIRRESDADGRQGSGPAGS